MTGDRCQLTLLETLKNTYSVFVYGHPLYANSGERDYYCICSFGPRSNLSKYTCTVRVICSPGKGPLFCRICKQAIQTWVLPTSQLARRVSTTRSPQTDSQGSSPSSRPHSSCFIICPHSPFVIISSCTSIDVRYLSSDSSASNFYEPSAPSQDGVPAQRQDGGGTAGMPGKLGTD